MYVYSITNRVNGKCYIGQTVYCDHRKRWNIHKSMLRSGKHKNMYLQSAWNKYGADSFSFDLVARARHHIELNELEIAEISVRQSTNRDFGYNLDLGGSSGFHSEETKQKIGNAHRGRSLKEETKKKLSEWAKANPTPPEGRAKHAEALRGKPRKVDKSLFSRWMSEGWKKRKENAMKRTCCNNVIRCTCDRPIRKNKPMKVAT